MTDPISRLTPLGLMVLALLGEGDMHPYEMIRLMRARRDDRLVTLTNGTVYHTVARLEKAALVAEVGVDRDGNRPERTTYTLTDAGAAAVPEWVRRELVAPGMPDRFRVALAEAHNLDRAEAIALLAVRRGALEQARDALAAGLVHAGEKGVPAQYLLELDRDVALIAADLAWLDTAVARISDPEFDWGSTGEPTERYIAQREAARQ